MNNESKYKKSGFIKTENRIALTMLITVTFICLLFTSCMTTHNLVHHQRNHKQIDPVCLAKVDISTAIKTEYNGQIYYFDSEECQKVFLKRPQWYASGEVAEYYYNISSIGWLGGGAMIALMLVIMSSMMIFAGIR